jgi:small subunit ribosomal protein S6
MRDYEALVIMKSAGTEQEVARQAAVLEEPIKKIGGTLKNAQNLGRRKFAFRIARQSEGYYFVLRFGAPTGQLAELDRLLRLNDSIVRFMILTADEVSPTVTMTNRSVERPGRPMGASSRS